MARTEDARAGWELYRNSGFVLSLGEISDRLTALGYAPIAPRTYDHYQRLRRRGFRRYIPINQLDTMSVPNPFADESIRSRYAYESANVPTQLIFHTPLAQVEVTGRADAISDFGTEIVVDETTQLGALREVPPPPKTPVTVNFLTPATTTYGTVDFVSLVDPSQVRVGIIFQRLIPVQEITGADALSTETCRFIVGADQSVQSLDSVSKDLYWLWQAVESARGLINALLDAVTEEDVVASPPTVESLHVESPLDLTLTLSLHVYRLLQRVLDTLSDIQTKAGGLARAAINRPVVEAQADLIQAQAEHLREHTKSLKLDNERKEILTDVVSEASAALISALRESGKKTNDKPPIDTERVATLLFDELEPALRELSPPRLELPEAGVAD